jgi:hypothetical protein
MHDDLPPQRPSFANSVPPDFDISSDEEDAFESSPRAQFSLDLPSPDLPPDGPPTPHAPSIYQRILVIFCLIVLWYTFSLLLSLYNKWMFAPAHFDFPFPLFVTSLHMLVQFLLSSIVLRIFPVLRPHRKDYMSPREYLLNIVPCGTATGMDIGLSNASLKFITLAFYSTRTAGEGLT